MSRCSWALLCGALLASASCDLELPAQPTPTAGVVTAGKDGSTVLRLAEEAGAAAFSADGKRLVTGGKNGLALWDLTSGARLGWVAGGERFEVTRVEVRADGQLAAVAEGFNTSKGGVFLGSVDAFDDVRFATSLAATRGVAPDFQDFSWGPPRRIAAKAKEAMKVVDLDGKGIVDIGKLEGYGDGAIDRIALDPTGAHAAYSFQLYGPRGRATTYRVFLWDLKAGGILWDKALEGAVVKQLRFSPDGTILAVGTTQLTLLYPLAADRELEPIDVGGMAVSISFSPDARRIAVANGRGKKARVYAVATGEVVIERGVSVNGIDHYAFSADGARLAVIGGKKVELFALP